MRVRLTEQLRNQIETMKTKFSIACAVIAAATFTFTAGNAAFGQMYGGQKNTTSSTAAAPAKPSDDTKGLKPGASLGGGKFVPITVTAEEAAKKYPPPSGKSYPNGMDEQVLKGSGTAAHSGFIKSPYSSRVYDCRKVGAGTLLLDDAVKKVFVRP